MDHCIMDVGFFMGLPWYIWAFVVLAILIMGLAFAIMIILHLMGPTIGYLKARLQKKNNVALLLQNNDCVIKPVDYLQGVFSQMGLSWIQRAKEHFTFGILNLEILYDSWGFSTNARVNLALQEFITAWNSDPELQKITDHSTLYQAIETLPSTDEIRIKAFEYVPVQTIRTYLQDVTAGDITGHIEGLKAIEGANRGNSGNSYLPLITGAIGLVLGAAIVYLSSGAPAA